MNENRTPQDYPPPPAQPRPVDRFEPPPRQQEQRPDLQELSPEELNRRLTDFERQAHEASRGAVEQRKFGLGGWLLSKIVGRRNVEAMADWMENTHAGKYTKIALKIVGGGGAVTLAGTAGLLLVGIPGLVATPLLYSLGTKKFAEGVVEAVQEVAPTRVSTVETEQLEGLDEQEQPRRIVRTQEGRWQWFGGRRRRKELICLEAAKQARIRELSERIRQSHADRDAQAFNEALRDYEEFVRTSDSRVFNDGQLRTLAEAREDFARWNTRWNTAKQVVSTAATVGYLGHRLLTGSIAADFDWDKAKHFVRVTSEGLRYLKEVPVYDDVTGHLIGRVPEWVSTFSSASDVTANSARTLGSAVTMLGSAVAGLATDAVMAHRAGLSEIDVHDARRVAEIQSRFGQVALNIPQGEVARDADEYVNQLRDQVQAGEVWYVSRPGLTGQPEGRQPVAYHIDRRSDDQLTVIPLDETGQPMGGPANWVIGQFEVGSERVGRGLDDFRQRQRYLLNELLEATTPDRRPASGQTWTVQGNILTDRDSNPIPRGRYQVGQRYQDFYTEFIPVDDNGRRTGGARYVLVRELAQARGARPEITPAQEAPELARLVSLKRPQPGVTFEVSGDVQIQQIDSADGQLEPGRYIVRHLDQENNRIAISPVVAEGQPAAAEHYARLDDFLRGANRVAG